MKKPSLLERTELYHLKETDFHYSLEKLLFVAINNLFFGGIENIQINDIVLYIEDNLRIKRIFEKENGLVYLQDCFDYSKLENFDYYYNHLKKTNLLIQIQSTGRSIEKFYCDDILNPNYQIINDSFEKTSIEDIILYYKTEISELEREYVIGSLAAESRAEDDIDTLMEDLLNEPEIGCALQGDYYNHIHRGARKGKYYLRSASSGLGKSRNMVGDACYLAYPKRYNSILQKWEDCGDTQKVLYIMTEQDPEEIKTMILSYLTDLNEEKFLYADFTQEELVLVGQAVEIIKENQNLYFAHIPDPCSSLVKNVIRNHHYRFNIEHFFYDYIFSSPALLSEYRTVAEHVALRLLSTTLKNLAVELNSFVMSSTQISIDRNDRDGFKDEQYLQGSRAIANVVDCGCIMNRPSQEELYLVKDFSASAGIQPNLVTDVYKNRRGKYTKVRIFSYIDLGTCRKKDLFVTDSTMKRAVDVTIIKFDRNTGEVTEKFNTIDDFDLSAENLLAKSDVSNEFESRESKKNRIKERSFDDLL